MKSFIKFKVRIRFKNHNISQGIDKLFQAFDTGSIGNLDIFRISDKKLCENHYDPEIEIDQQEKEDVILIIKLPLCIGGLGTGLPLLLNSLLYCSVFSFIEKYRIIEVNLPIKLLKEFKGPRFGIEGIRNFLGVNKRPILGLILKPRLRIELDEIISIIKNALYSGIDYIIDDELVVDPLCCPFSERAKYINSEIQKIQKETEKNYIYFLNVTSDIEKAKKQISEAINIGIKGFALNAVTMGFSAVKYLIDLYSGKAFFVINNIGRGIMTRSESYSIAENVLAFFSRIVGGDAVYTGPLTMDFPYNKAVLMSEIDKLQFEIGNLKPAFAISSGSIFLNNILKNEEILGKDLMVQMGHGLLDNKNKMNSKIKIILSIFRILSETKNKKERQDIISEYFNILRRDKSINKEYKVENLQNIRIKDLNNNLKEDLKLLKEVEDQIRGENDPTGRYKLENEKKKLQSSIQKFSIEKELLISKNFDNFKKESILENNKLLNLFLNIVDELDYKDRELGKINNNLNKLIIFLNEKELQFPDKMRTNLKSLNSSSIGLNNKLKLTIPIIPFLFQYETEIFTEKGFSLKDLWQKILNYLRKNIT